MWFLDYIFYALVDIRDWFYSAYDNSKNWGYPFHLVAIAFWHIYWGFSTVVLNFYYFRSWCNDVNTKITQGWSIEQLTSYFQTWINYATTAYNWVYYAFSNVSSIVNTWWSSTQQTVLAWIDDAKSWLQTQIDSLSVWVNNLQASINELLAQIPSINEILAWFADWWARILSPLTSWWNERLLDVKSLIQSELKDWFPFYDDLVNLWSSIKEFFTDPLGWLEGKFTDWFLGAE